ncbi:hypothetical protein LCGC14_1087450 [marine sediment metagenome]|uniref:Glycosyltransferase RgtA/B/C/D-like domain-containing protein n=1 Tax=marine sediment metagenome TaxID=412755 RepID=A0A0F9MHT9_9ZZZZ|nr:MAG: hypothetical protein Lokiarch_46550 [Candidatus Lokiarchaeum sp. GC14_75]
MMLNRIWLRMINRFKELWKFKIFKYTVVIHVGYFILSLVLTLIFLRDRNDFLVYYKVGQQVLTDINELYTTTNNWPFRYLPISALYFVPFYLIGFDLGFVVFNSINLVLNILISIILYKIVILVRRDDHEKGDRRIILYICLYMISLPQLFNFILGQINQYVTLLILLSLFIYLKNSGIKWDLIASIVLGVSIMIKPITIFMIPFLIVIHFDIQNKKLTFSFTKSFVRLIGMALPLSLNFIMFIVYPNLLEGFIGANFTSSDPSQINHSFSLTKLIINFLYFIQFNKSQVLSIQMPLFLIILLIISIFAFISFSTRNQIKYSLIYGYSLGILIMFLCYFDSWDHHLLNFTPLLIIIIFNLPSNSDLTKKIIKPSFYFLSFLDLAFMGIFFLTKKFFPFNFASTIFLILTFYGLIKYNTFKNNKQ